MTKIELSLRRWAGLLLAILVSSCGSVDQPGTTSAAGPPRSFVTFRRGYLWIDRLNVPIDPPYAAGSTVSRELLAVDHPDVVEIDRNGWLIGRKNGKALVRTASGSKLEVTVAAAHTLTFQPATVRLAAGEAAVVQLLADGQPVPFDSAQWFMSDPATATLDRAGLHANRPGRAVIRAHYGSASIELPVSVDRTAAPIRLQVRHQRLVPGQIVEIRTTSGSAAVWSSSNDAVLQSIGDGVYIARHRGLARACVQDSGRTACAELEVLPSITPVATSGRSER